MGYVCKFNYRIIKEAMCSSGANATRKHLEDISMCALFMLDVCKRVDAMFGVPYCGTHTTRDPQGDIRKIASYLCEQTVTTEVENRQGWSFDDPRISGYKKDTKKYTHTRIQKGC